MSETEFVYEWSPENAPDYDSWLMLQRIQKLEEVVAALQGVLNVK